MVFDEPRIPIEASDHPAIPLIKQLLNREPARRGTVSSLKNHEWFSTMNWEDLYYRNIKPPYTPTVEQTDLTSPMRGTIEETLLNDELEDRIRIVKPSPAGWDENF